jgi:uncharacterized UPF0160 family protein
VKKFITHSGRFHADEVTAFAILLLAKESDEFERIKDIANYPYDENENIVGDIGRVYDPENMLFDHHQGLILRPNGYPYATAGMIWKEFGEQAVKHLFPELSSENIEYVMQEIDETLIQGIDAHDSDNSYNFKAHCVGGEVEVLTFSVIIAMLNSKDLDDNERQFEKATYFTKDLIRYKIRESVSRLQDKEIVRSALIEDNVMILPKICRWRKAVEDEFPDIRFVISPSAHPGADLSMIAVAKEGRTVHIPIERPEWFDGFIHQGKWIAGSDSEIELIEIAKHSTVINEIRDLEESVNVPTVQFPTYHTYESALESSRSIDYFEQFDLITITQESERGDRSHIGRPLILISVENSIIYLRSIGGELHHLQKSVWRLGWNYFIKPDGLTMEDIKQYWGQYE